MESKLRSDEHESYQAYNRDECAKQHEVTRYADDCIILIGSSKAADRVMENVSKFIEKKLGLKVNMTKSKVSKPNDIKYLGFGFFYDKHAKLWKAKPYETSMQKLKEKIKELTSRSRSVSMDYRLLKLNN